jgi:hypothetical protein
MWNRALSITEIKQLSALGQSTANSSAAVRPANGGLVAWWTFDGQDMYGANFYDKSGRNNTGVASSTPTKLIGRIGQGITIGGGSGDGIYATVANLPSGSSPRTISAWFKPTTDNDITLAGVFGYPYNGYGGGTNMWFEVKYSDAGDDKFGFHLYNTHYLSTNTFPINKWYHLVALYTGSVLRLYVNGALEIEQTVALNTSVNPSGYNFNIHGRVNQYVDAMRGGTLDDLRIWNRALSATEIKQLYNATK